MRKWVKWTLAVVAVLAIGFLALAGTGAYFVFRHLETRSATEADTRGDFEAIRTRFAGRPPMVEIRNLTSGDLLVHRLVHPAGLRAKTVHVLTWEADEGRLLSTNVPLWLMRFSTVNVLSHLGIAPEKFRVTAEDLERYGPGIVVDFRQPERSQVLIWLE